MAGHVGADREVVVLQAVDPDATSVRLNSPFLGSQLQSRFFGQRGTN